MAEECADGFGNEVEFSRESVNDLQYDQISRGVIFTSDVQSDFFLDDNVDTDEEDEVLDAAAALDEIDLAWTSDDPNKASETMDHLRTAPQPYDVLLKDMMKLTEDSGVMKMVLEYGGNTAYPPEGSKVYYHYSAWLNEAQDPFDTTVGRNADSLIVGAPGDVIRGVRIAVESMKLYEVAQFVIFPEYAYGKLGCPPRVGKDEKVIFTIKVVHFIKADRLKNNLKLMTSTQRNEILFDQILNGVCEMRRSANTKYRSKDYCSAIRGYRYALEIMEGYWGIRSKEEEDKRFDFLCGVFCNLAQAYVKLGKGAQACNACKNALRYNVPHRLGRIYVLFAKAHGCLASYDKAQSYLATALMHDANKKDCSELQLEFAKAKKESDKRYSQMCESMFKMDKLTNEQKENSSKCEPGPSTEAAQVHATEGE